MKKLWRNIVHTVRRYKKAAVLICRRPESCRLWCRIERGLSWNRKCVTPYSNESHVEHVANVRLSKIKERVAYFHAVLTVE